MKTEQKLKLGVNIDHIATLRQARLDIDAHLLAVHFKFRGHAGLAIAALSARSVSVPVSARR